MGQVEHGVQRGARTALTLFALGRIPRCRRCPRYHVYLNDRSFGSGQQVLPEVPPFCRYQVCAPLARRYEASGAGRERRVSAE